MASPSRTPIALSLLLAAAARSFAQQEMGMEDILELLAEEHASTAGKTEQKVARVAGTITVLTEEDIRLSGAVTLPDVLRLVPGLEVTSGLASDSPVGIRKLSNRINESIMVLVDGRPIYVDYLGSAFFESLPIALCEIERIEIVRGPSSTVWGANAASGVINIITRKPRDLAGFTASALGGTYGLADGSAVGAADSGAWGFLASAGTTAVDSFADRSERAYSTPRAHVKLEWDPGEGTSLVADAGYARLDGRFLTDLGGIDRGGTVEHLMATFARSGLTVRAYGNRTDVTLVPDLYGGQSHAHAYTLAVDAFQTWSLNRAEVTAGAQYQHLAVRSDFSGDKTLSQDLEGLYGQGILHLGDKVEATLGLRYDHHSVTRPQLSPHAGLVFEPRPGHVLRADYGTAFRNPALIEFYLDAKIKSPYEITLLPNLDLDPERNETATIGYRFAWKQKLALDVAIWQGSVRDTVRFETVEFIPGTDLPKTLQFRNTEGTARGRGVETSLRWNLPRRVSLLASHAFEDFPDNRELPTVGALPRHTFTAAVRTARPRGIEGQLAIQRVTSWSVLGQDLPAYTDVWGSVGYAFGLGHDRALSVRAAGQNLLDDDHREYPGGEILRRRMGLMATLRLP